MTKTQQERAQELLEELRSGHYDTEAVHIQYDAILEEFIKQLFSGGVPPLLPTIMLDLIKIEKDFWYA